MHTQYTDVKSTAEVLLFLKWYQNVNIFRVFLERKIDFWLFLSIFSRAITHSKICWATYFFSTCQGYSSEGFLFFESYQFLINMRHICDFLPTILDFWRPSWIFFGPWVFFLISVLWLRFMQRGSLVSRFKVLAWF